MGQDQTTNSPQTLADRKTQPGSNNPNNPSAKQNPADQQTQQSANKPAGWEQNAGKSPQQQQQTNPQQLKTKLKEAFGRLSEDEISLYDTQKDQFFNKLQDKYGLAREEAED